VEGDLASPCTIKDKIACVEDMQEWTSYAAKYGHKGNVYYQLVPNLWARE
jgi:hypothetical protein